MNRTDKYSDHSSIIWSHAKWLSVPLRTKLFWVRVQLKSCIRISVLKTLWHWLVYLIGIAPREKKIWLIQLISIGDTVDLFELDNQIVKSKFKPFFNNTRNINNWSTNFIPSLFFSLRPWLAIASARRSFKFFIFFLTPRFPFSDHYSWLHIFAFIRYKWLSRGDFKYRFFDICFSFTPLRQIVQFLLLHTFPFSRRLLCRSHLFSFRRKNRWNSSFN